MVSCLSASAPSAAILASIQRPVATYSPAEAEILREVRALGRYKSLDSSGLPSATFKDKGEERLEERQVLFSVWHSEEVSSVVVPISEKSLHSDCADRRGISLIPMPLKLLSFIIPRELYNTCEGQTLEEQAWFPAYFGA